MGDAQPAIQYTEDEYFDFCDAHEGRYEFYKGEIFAMAGAIPDHNEISSNVHGQLYQQLRGKKCKVFGPDQRLYIAFAALFTFPALSIYCEPRQVSTSRKDSFTNPTVLIEILSESTAEYDQGGKFDFYKTIPSLQEYVLIFSDRQRVAVHRRYSQHEWAHHVYPDEGPEVLLRALQISILVSDIYDGVILPVLNRRPGS